VPIDGVLLPQDEQRKLLSVDEQARAGQFRLQQAMNRFITTRAALRTLLGHYLQLPPNEVRLSIAANRKPQLAGDHSEQDLRFNVSHSGNLAVLAVGHGNEIGVDLERLRHISHAEQIARRYFHKNEIAAIGAAVPADRESTFLRCWTSKEAILKAIGVGIAGSLDLFEVPSDESFEGHVNLAQLRATSAVADCWLARVVPHRDYLAAVAVLGSRKQLQCHTLIL
jgi:4'-phosphopantetheinyl transferase